MTLRFIRGFFCLSAFIASVLPVLHGQGNSVIWNSIGLPSTGTAGSTITFYATLTNSGSTTWDSNYYVQLSDPADNHLYFTSLSGTAPGSSKTVAIVLQLPEAAGSYTYGLTAMQYGVEYFGGAQWNTITVTTPQNGVTWNSINNPATGVVDNQIIFTATLTNSGGTSWDSNYYVQLSDAADNHIHYAGLNGVGPGATTTVSFPLMLPSSPGVYTYGLTAMQNGVQYFGGTQWFNITVTSGSLQYQYITFSSIPAKTVSSPAFSISASASSGLPVSFGIISGPATINGSLITLGGAVGTVTVRAYQGGNSIYGAATPVDQSFVVLQGGASTVSGSGYDTFSITVPAGSANLQFWTYHACSGTDCTDPGVIVYSAGTTWTDDDSYPTDGTGPSGPENCARGWNAYLNISAPPAGQYTVSSWRQAETIYWQYTSSAQSLSAPSGLSSSAVQSTSFVLSWSGVAGASYYKIDIATDSSFSSLVPGWNNFDAGGSTSVSVTGLTGGTTYYCRVRAGNTAGVSSSSATYSLTTPAWDPNADTDGDGVSNGIELMLGLNPADPNDVSVMQYQYDKRNQLKSGSAGTYTKDAEGNIRSVTH